MAIQESIILVLLLALSAVGFCDYSTETYVLIPDALGTGGFPMICAGFLVLSIGALALSRFGQRRRGVVASKPEPVKKIIYIMFSVVFVYIVGFIYVGFYVSTSIFNVVCLFILFKEDGGVKAKNAVIYTACVMLCWYALFATFKLYLPSAMLI